MGFIYSVKSQGSNERKKIGNNKNNACERRREYYYYGRECSYPDEYFSGIDLKKRKNCLIASSVFFAFFSFAELLITILFCYHSGEKKQLHIIILSCFVIYGCSEMIIACCSLSVVPDESVAGNAVSMNGLAFVFSLVNVIYTSCCRK